VSANVIEIHVETIIANHPIDLISVRFFLVVDCLVEIIFFQYQFALLKTTGGSKYFQCAHQSRKLTDGSAYRARCARDKNSFALMQISDPRQPNIGRESWHAKQPEIKGKRNIIGGRIYTPKS